MIEVILIIIALVFFTFLSLVKPKISLGLVLIFLSSYLIRFKILGIPFTFLEMMILILFASWLVKALIKKKEIFLSHYFPLILLFLLSGIVAVFISPDLRAALGIYKAYFIEPILFFIVFINIIKEKKDLKFSLFCLAVGALFISLLTIWQYLGLFPGLEPYISEIPKRVTSIFDFPTAVGKYLGPITAIFMALIFVKSEERLPKSYQAYLWGVVVFSLLAIVFSFTRGALLGLAVALFFISFFSRYRRIIWLIFLLALIIIFALPFCREQVFSVISGSDTSTDVHLIMWQGTWRMLKAHPITGAGLAGFPILYNIYRDPAHIELFPYPDNWFLAIWSELGLAGLIIFAWLIVKMISGSLNLIKKKAVSYYYKIAVGLLAAVICLLVHGLIDTPYFKNDLSVIFWSLVGILTVIEKIAVIEQNNKVNKN